MRQTPEAKAFLKRIISLPKGPGISLDEVLQPSLDDEAELRRLFATNKDHVRLNDPLVGLVDVFDAPANIRTTRARIVKDDQELSAKYVMPLSEVNRRKEGSPSMVNNLEEFKRNWSIFTEGSLSQLSDWNNVVAAGGAVLACLTPLSDAAKKSNRSIRKYYHSAAYPSSDVDLFLWGMNAEQAEKKIIAIYEAIRDSVPWEVTCVRTKHTVSIHSQYPYRSVQIVLRLYSSPAEILAGFDIDAPCCLYNGQRVLAKPRAIVAMMRQANTVDMSRRSPSYEVRLAKYSRRAFEVYVPSLKRDNVDPTIYERSIARIEGLARLLVLEKLANTDVRSDFMESRRSLRGRHDPPHQDYIHNPKRMYKGDLKASDTSTGGLEMNDYDVATLHIPYGPGWDAGKIDKLVYQTDLGMNSPFNPKNKDRRLHRHPAFFGTMKECLEDCCEYCPEPIDSDERKLQQEEDETHIRGRIAFIEEDPGRQSMTGSFNPIDVGEWSAQVYIGKTKHLFGAIVAHNTEAVSKMIKNKIDVNRRDHVGRTALHVAILTGATDIACALIDAGARITARLVDGRNALHLAAQFDQPEVIRRLFEKSASNKVAAGKIKPEEDVDVPAAGRPSSEDDWTSVDDGVISIHSDEDVGDSEAGDDEDDGDEDEDYAEISDEEGADGNHDNDGRGRIQKEPAENAEDGTQGFPEDSTNQPDILEVDLPDWVLKFTPLAHAVVSGSLAGIEELFKAGADVTVLLNITRYTAFHSLTLTILREDEDEACKILERLISAGASTSMADKLMRTIFHRAVSANKVKLVSTILKYDMNADFVLNFPCFDWCSVIFPVVIAIDRRHYSMLATLLAHGAKIAFTAEDVTRALDATPQMKQRQFFPYGIHHAIHSVFLPVESALARRDDVAQLLIALDADFNIGLRESFRDISQRSRLKSIIDWVQSGINFFSEEISFFQEAVNFPLPTAATEDPAATGWKKYLADHVRENNKVIFNEMLAHRKRDVHGNEQHQNHRDSHSYLVDLERVLLARGARTWNEIYPNMPSEEEKKVVYHPLHRRPMHDPTSRYSFLGRTCHEDFVAQHLGPIYDELFEACFTGDNKKIEQLCLPREESDNTTPLCVYVIKDIFAGLEQYTPLFAAIRGRQWATAKLIMAIAIAQYTPPEDEEKFSTRGFKIYDFDSDDGSEGSDDTAGYEETTFVDIAKRHSSIETYLHPRRILQATFSWYIRSADGTNKNEGTRGSLLQKAIHDNDLEMFTNVASLYNAAPLPIPFGVQDVGMLLRYDRAEMLDVYIRRTGLGIDIDVQKDPEERQGGRNDKDRVYLGLSVHGKKMADLAKMNDPNAKIGTQGHSHCLLWMAAEERATAIVEYLAGDRPLAAYRHYATHGGDERAYQLRRVPDLGKVLPQWLGWRISGLGDSPLMAAVIGGSLGVIKAMFAKKRKFMGSCLHERVKFTGYNALMLAVDQGCGKDVIDYLLAKSISPVVNDSVRGWNIYHILCSRNFDDLIEHLLTKLPRTVNEALLAQRSKERFNTPLHLAVKNGATRAIKLILDFTKSNLLMRDLDGSTPLHCAVQAGFANISSTLISAATPPEALYMENGVGQTPLDMARLRHTLNLTRWLAADNARDVGALSVRHTADKSPRRIDLGMGKLESELPRLRLTIGQLVAEGKLVPGTKLVQELCRFAEMMEKKVGAEKAAVEARSVDAVAVGRKDRNGSEVCDEKRTLEVVSAAVAAAPGTRLLVHLVDVQKSVHGNMARYAKKNEQHKDKDKEKDDEGESGKADGLESQERRGSLVLSRIDVGPDRY